MSETAGSPALVRRGQDRCGEEHNVGIGVFTFKVTAAESNGALMVVELVHHTAGGPPRHVHPRQDEWFYVLEGRYRIDAGDQQFSVGPGDSVFGPRGVPHTWAFLGGDPGRIIFAVAPAVQMEEFMLALSRSNAMAPQDPAFWQQFGLELVGPPILRT